jgi:hypothetical protein
VVCHWFPFSAFTYCPLLPAGSIDAPTTDEGGIRDINGIYQRTPEHVPNVWLLFLTSRDEHTREREHHFGFFSAAADGSTTSERPGTRDPPPGRRHHSCPMPLAFPLYQLTCVSMPSSSPSSVLSTCHRPRRGKMDRPHVQQDAAPRPDEERGRGELPCLRSTNCTAGGSPLV